MNKICSVSRGKKIFYITKLSTLIPVSRKKEKKSDLLFCWVLFCTVSKLQEKLHGFTHLREGKLHFPVQFWGLNGNSELTGGNAVKTKLQMMS